MKSRWLLHHLGCMYCRWVCEILKGLVFSALTCYYYFSLFFLFPFCLHALAVGGKVGYLDPNKPFSVTDGRVTISPYKPTEQFQSLVLIHENSFKFSSFIFSFNNHKLSWLLLWFYTCSDAKGKLALVFEILYKYKSVNFGVCMCSPDDTPKGNYVPLIVFCKNSSNTISQHLWTSHKAIFNSSEKLIANLGRNWHPCTLADPNRTVLIREATKKPEITLEELLRSWAQVYTPQTFFFLWKNGNKTAIARGKKYTSFYCTWC